MINVLLAALLAVTATKEYVDRKDAVTYTNAVNAAKVYTDEAIQEAGSVTPSIVTNIAGRVTSNVVTKAYVEGLGISGGGVDTNAVSRIATNVAEYVVGSAGFAKTNSSSKFVGGKVGTTFSWGSSGSSTRVYGVDYANQANIALSATSATRANDIGIVNSSTAVYKTFGFESSTGNDPTIVLQYGIGGVDTVKTNAYLNDVEGKANAFTYPNFGSTANVYFNENDPYELELSDTNLWRYQESRTRDIQLWFEDEAYDSCRVYWVYGTSSGDGLLYRNGDTYSYTNTVASYSIVATFPNLKNLPNPAIANAAMLDGSGNNITNTYATKSEVANRATKDYVASTSVTNMGAAAYADAKDNATKQIVYTWENFLDGSNVVFSITNYISGSYSTDYSKLTIKELRDGVYREVYSSHTDISNHINLFKTNDFQTATNQVITTVNAAIASKADKAWGNYTSAGTDIAAIGYSNTVYMTAPNTVFAGGMEYERVAVGEGSICVLTTKGAPTYTTGDEGTFKFQSDGGTNYFGFAKTDSYVIGCDTDGISVANNLVTLTYNVTMTPRKPCIWYNPTLTNAWEQLSLPDGSAISGASHQVSWDPNPDPGTEVCWINCTEAKGFFRATIEVAGTAKFMTNMPADLMGGILCTNTATHVIGIIKPTYNGSTVNWTWSAQ